MAIELLLGTTALKAIISTTAGKLAGIAVEQAKTKLSPGELERSIAAGIDAAQIHDRTLSPEQHLFFRCDDKQQSDFLRQVMVHPGMLTELRKPLEQQGSPDADCLIKVFEQVAADLELSIGETAIRAWVRSFVDTYFEQTSTAIKFQVAKERYLAALVNSCDDIKFVGIDAAVPEQDRANRLLSIFVVPDVVAEQDSKPDRSGLLRGLPDHLDAEQADLWLEQQERFADRSTSSLSSGVSAHQLLAANRRKVVLLGNPGAGKTMLMRYFAVKLARQEAADIGLPATEDWFPILVYLRNWAKQPDRSLIAQLEDFARNTLHVETPTGFFQYWLERRSLILLDGLDEVINESTRAQLVEKLECALEENESIAVVITSRPWGYNRAYFHTETFPHFELAPFSDRQIQQFIQKWYESRHENLDDARLMIANLNESLDENERVKQLVRNPLLLTIVGLTHRYQDTLPKRRHELYNKAVNTLLKSWDRTAKGLREQQKEFFRILDIDDDLRRVMSLLALWLHQQYATPTSEGGTLVRERTLIEQLSEIIRTDYDNFPLHKIDAEAERFVTFIRDRTGLINEYGRGIYGFVHKTFQEYLTAEAIQKEARYDFSKILTFIRAHLHQPHWREVILLLVSQQEEEGAARAIDCIAQAQSEYEHWLHRDLLLAAECLTDDPPRLRKADRKLISSILTGLVELAASDPEVVGSRPRRKAQQLLKRLRSTDFQADALKLIQEQGESINRWAKLEYQFHLGESEQAIAELSKLLTDSDDDIQKSAAFTLGKLGNASDKVIDALINLFADPNDDVKSSAADALGKLGNASDEVIDALINLLTDLDDDVKSNAADALGKLGNASDKVIGALINLLTDPNDIIQSSAADALGKLGNASDKVIDALINLLTDLDDDVKSNAADALGKLSNASDKVIGALINLLTDLDGVVA